MTDDRNRELATKLKLAQQRETAAKQERLAVEEEILTAYADEIKPEGTNNLGPFKIVTGYTRKWDNDKLNELATRIKPEFFPFAVQYKENTKLTKSIETANPELYNELATALTLKPKKPSIKLNQEAA